MTLKKLLISVVMLSASAGAAVAACETPIRSKGHMSSCLNASCGSDWVWMCAVGTCYASAAEMANGCFPKNGESCTLIGCYTVYGCYSCWE